MKPSNPLKEKVKEAFPDLESPGPASQKKVPANAVPVFTPLFVHSSIDDAGLSPRAFRVLCHLARQAYRRPKVFPSIQAIAKTCRMRKTNVIDAIQELESRRMIAVTRQSGKPNTYRLTLNQSHPLDPDQSPG
jgi:hypothetical protein